MKIVNHDTANSNALFSQVQNWIYRNGRHIEIMIWNYHFQNGTKEDVLHALMEYQNEDGGFGHALEPDNWNPESSPVTTHHALKILAEIEFYDMKHPIYQKIWNYLSSKKDLCSYGWRFTISGNDYFPHAPWWNYNEEENTKEYYGVTAGFCSFILKFGEKESELYHNALQLTNHLVQSFMTDDKYGDMGLESFISFVDTLRTCKILDYDCSKLDAILRKKITLAIEHDTEKWKYYGVLPSNFIHSPESPFYLDNKDIVQKELNYLLDTIPENNVWAITWTWFDNMESYTEYFYISANWWKAFKAIGNMIMLKNFKLI